MKKIVLSVIMMGLCSMSMMAQEQQQAKQPKEKTQKEQPAQAEQKSEKEREFKGLNISIQGGALYSMNENAWTYNNDSKAKDPKVLQAAREKVTDLTSRVTPQASLTVGYDFGHAFGIRVQAGYSKNASAGNHNQDPLRGFHPYTFNAITGFADAVFNISGFVNSEKQHLLETKLYVGAGLAKSSLGEDKYIKPATGYIGYATDFSKSQFGFRAGLIEEFYINKHMGAFVDANLEAFSDMFNGRKSGEYAIDDDEDGSFPYDLRVVGSFGLVFHF